jgi:exopolysaccharide biosynthesis protein
LRFESANRTSEASVVRVDPALLRFRVAYAPDMPLTLQRWHEQNNALVTINGGFFDAQNRTTSLLISDGVVSGESYVGRGGLFAVDAAGAVTVRYLAEQPYDPAEAWLHALEGWPMLVRPGGVLAYTFEDAERARRSVLAIDQEGQILLIAVATPTLTLRELAEWLASSDLAIDAAINLDGGSSTGLLLAGPQQSERIDAFVPLPIVLMVLPP